MEDLGKLEMILFISINEQITADENQNPAFSGLSIVGRYKVLHRLERQGLENDSKKQNKTGHTTNFSTIAAVPKCWVPSKVNMELSR